jgi:hypothetical protein
MPSPGERRVQFERTLKRRHVERDAARQPTMPNFAAM